MRLSKLSSSMWLVTLLSVVCILLANIDAKAQAAPSINLEITTHLGDGQVFEHGDSISFLLNLDIDAYLFVVYQDAKGHLVQLLPNTLAENELYTAGSFISIPGADSKFSFTVAPPYGRETIYAFATTKPFPQLKGASLKNGLRVLEIQYPQLERLVDQHIAKTGARFGTATLQLVTRAKSSEL